MVHEADNRHNEEKSYNNKEKSGYESKLTSGSGELYAGRRLKIGKSVEIIPMLGYDYTTYLFRFANNNQTVNISIQKLAEDLGFTVQVDETFPHHCLRSCIYPLWEQKYRYILRVTVYGIPGAYMTCLDDVLTPLLTSDAGVLECTLNRYKLGGLYYEFYYANEQ